jgi:hypothetical protein
MEKAATAQRPDRTEYIRSGANRPTRTNGLTSFHSRQIRKSNTAGAFAMRDRSLRIAFSYDMEIT